MVSPLGVFLASDSGISSGDRHTNNSTVRISGLEAGATWQYSLNGGASWLTGSGTTIRGISGDGHKSVLVKQTDLAGNVSANSQLNFDLDTVGAYIQNIQYISGGINHSGWERRLVTFSDEVFNFTSKNFNVVDSNFNNLGWPANPPVITNLGNNRQFYVDYTGHLLYTKIGGYYSYTTAIFLVDMKGVIDKAGNQGQNSWGYTESYTCPLVFDFTGQGVQTIDLSYGVNFDLDSDGDQEATGWIGSGSGLLTLDINQNGLIDDGSELFGTSTKMNDGAKASNGFEALAQYDLNLDHVIDVNDEIFSKLQIWLDSNANGMTDDGELRSLEQMGIKSINLQYSEQQGAFDVNGNDHFLKGSYTNSEGVVSEVVDIWFRQGEAIVQQAPLM
jgi:hypothetical protein